MSVETREVGELWVSDMVSLTWPLVELIATEEHLTFRARFGLGHLLGPWQLDRKHVRAVAATKGGLVVRGVEVHGTEGQRWVFRPMSRSKEQVTRELAALGYPTDL